MTTNQPYQEYRRPRWRGNLALLAFLAIGGFFLVTEHAAHLFGILPYLLLLLCPLLHLLHGGHGGHGRHDTQPHQTKGEKR